MDVIFCVHVLDNGSEPVNSSGYHAVAFSYGNPDKTIKTKNNDTESGFRPHFPVPESLLPNLVSNSSLISIPIMCFSEDIYLTFHYLTNVAW